METIDLKYIILEQNVELIELRRIYLQSIFLFKLLNDSFVLTSGLLSVSGFADTGRYTMYETFVNI